MSFKNYEKTRGAVVVSAGMLVKYWRRGDADLSAMIAELAADVDAHRAATAKMHKEAKSKLGEAA